MASWPASPSQMTGSGQSYIPAPSDSTTASPPAPTPRLIVLLRTSWRIIIGENSGALPRISPLYLHTLPSLATGKTAEYKSWKEGPDT